MSGRLLVLATLLIAAHFASAGFVEVAYTTTLSGEQVVPGPGEDAYATAVCIYERYATPVTLDCQVQHNVTDILSLGVYNGSSGNTGTLQFAFSDITQGRNLRETFEFPVDSEDLQNDFLFGRMYLQINSNEFPGGSLRGQLLQNDRAYARMTAEQTIPPSTGTTSEGIALATYAFANPERWLSVDVVHDVRRPTGIDMRAGASNQVGQLVATFDHFESPAFDNVQLTQREGEQLLEDILFLNVRSETNPDGDIRGQLVSIDYVSVGAFTAHMTGDKVVPEVDTEHTGCVIVTFNCDTDIMEYVVFHSLDFPTGAFLGIGGEEDQGVLIASLADAQSPIYGAIKLDDNESFELYANRMFVTITVGEGIPAIRGPLNTDHSYFAYLSGTNEVGPVTTAYHGCGIARLNEEMTAIEFEVHHNVPNPVVAGFYGGAEGEVGRLRFQIENLNVVVDGDDELSPWSGTFELDDDDLQALIQERLYFNIETLEHPNGVIRGNFKKLDPCNDDDDDGLPAETSYNVLSYFSAFYSSTYSADIQIRSSASLIQLSLAAVFVALVVFIL